MSEDDKPLEHADNPWATVGKSLPPIGSSPEARLRGWTHWVETVRPQMRHEQPYGPVETPEAKLERLRRTVWNEPLDCGYELAQKLIAMREELRHAPPA